MLYVFSQGCLIKANWFWCLIGPQDMWFYISEHEKFNEFGSESALVWHETNIPYAVYGPESTRTLSMKYYPSEVSLIVCTKFDSWFLSSTIWRYIYFFFQALKHNGSLYAHVFFARSGYPADPNDPEYLPLAAFGKTHRKMATLGAFADFLFKSIHNFFNFF